MIRLAVATNVYAADAGRRSRLLQSLVTNIIEPALCRRQHIIFCHSIFAMLAGIVDDIYGASFIDGAVSGDPMDKNGHGTFVAGVVGAVGNNNLVCTVLFTDSPDSIALR